MDIKGFHVDSEVTTASNETPDGFITTVTAKDGTVRGPFNTIREAIQCAHTWQNENKNEAPPQAAVGEVENGGAGEKMTEEKSPDSSETPQLPSEATLPASPTAQNEVK